MGAQNPYQPLLGRTCTIHRPVAPVAYDCVKLIVVRDGSAILFSEFGERPINVGGVVLLAANVLCGSEPEGHITVTTIYADIDYLLDQMFWQHADVLRDRLDTPGFADRLYTDPAQILRLGEERAGLLMPWLDELAALTIDGSDRARFHRMQALWFSIMDHVAPLIRVSPVRQSPTQRSRIYPTLPRDRRFRPVRAEAQRIREAVIADPARNWDLTDLAELVYLSPKQTGRVFTDAFGKTPLAFQTMLRVQEMARLLRESDSTTASAAVQVRWRSRNRATKAFQTYAVSSAGFCRGSFS